MRGIDMIKKKELERTIRELSKQNQNLLNELNKETIKKWNERLPQAVEHVHKELKKPFGNTVIKLVYEHVDDAGYWFTFELVNNKTRQSYCVRHTDF